MKISIVSLFPGMFEGFLQDSIVKRAQDSGKLELEFVHLRDFAIDTYGTVDDRPFGGGAGMVLMVEPVVKALEKTCGMDKKPYIVGTSARGKIFSQEHAQTLAEKDHLVILAGHYEGYDERVRDYLDEEISLGDFVLTGGELASACIVDAVVRLLPGVLKKEAATKEESFFCVPIDEVIEAVGQEEILVQLHQRDIKSIRLLEYPQYTRPKDFGGKVVPDILTSGDHKKIRQWQLRQAFNLTRTHRPDLLVQ